MKAGGLATWTEADKNKRTLRRDLRPSIGRVRRLCSNRSLKFTHDRFQVHDFFLTLETTPGFILPDMTQGVHIGKAAELAGVSVDTIRFYQKLGLIKRVGRSAGGYRLFDGEQIRDLTFVRHAQELGFSLNEVKELLVLRQKHHACSEVQSMLKRKVGDVQKKINSLSRLESELADALRNCNRELRLKREIKHEDCCPLLMKLDRINGSNGTKHVSNGRKPGD